MDHARKACVTSCPNLVTESQKYSKLRDFWEKWVTFGELFCEETLYVSRLWQESMRKTYSLFGHWNTIWSSNSEVLKLFLPLERFCAFYRASYKPHLHKILLCQSVVSQEHQALLFVLLGKLRTCSWAHLPVACHFLGLSCINSLK